MSTMESRSEPRRGGRLAPALLGFVIGLVIAVILVLNLHILVGLEDGYASTPTQVAEYSPALLVVDALLTIGLPFLGAMAFVRLFRRRRPVDGE